MKVIIFILILLSITIASYSQSYRYNKVITVDRGTDNFSFDQNFGRKEKGNILLKPNMAIVGSRKYKLKKQFAPSFFKSRGCSVKYLYCNNALAAVVIVRFNTSLYYCIDNAIASNSVVVK